MTIQERFKAAVSSFRRDNNSMGQELSRSFLRYGNNKPLVQDWSRVMMSDRDLYSGYPYAAINNRANKVAQLANENLKTDALPAVMKAAKAKSETVMHPYLDAIDLSPTFSNNKFWYDISTFLDLEGVYYLMVVRAVGTNAQTGGTRVGNIKEFQLLNPYDMRRIINKETLVVGGYVEARDGLVREFPPEMIIEIRKLNPFSHEDPFSMTDAAKESQYTLKQAGDYTRHSLKNNMAAPGIISTDMLLDTQQFQNFVSRVTNQEKGLPLFGNGSGAITWDSMQIDMDKAALDKINEINRQTLFAVSGVGKTMMSIEESGTTRDTARAQKEIFVEGHVMPQLQIILDALNQDYKTFFSADYAKNKYRLFIDNPLGSDRAAELQDVQIRDESYKLYDELVADGYDRALASKYASGEINLEELGEPTNDPRPNPIIEAAMLRSGSTPQNPNVEPPAADKSKPKDKPKPKPKPKAKDTSKDATQKHEHDHLTDEDFVLNQVDDNTSGIIQTAQGALQNTIVNIEGRIVSSVINNITKAKNAFEDQSDVITNKEKQEHERELELALSAFYLLLLPVLGKQNAAKRVAEFGGAAVFTMDSEIKKYVKELSNKVADSHVNTVIEDVRRTAQNVFNDNVKATTDAIEASGRAVTDADLVEARKLALTGASESKIVSAVKTTYSNQITEGRAKAIARTETNRAFTQSQYVSDKQFIEQNGFEERAYKQLQTRSTDPCPVCTSLASNPPIPFYDNFASIGDTLSASYTDKAGKTKVQVIPVNFEDITAGNIHTNCSCEYVLIIKPA